VDRLAETFEEHRPALLGLAYRLLGSMWDAEDVVQDAYVRWSRVDRDEVRDPRAYLVTVVSRLALDQLRSARVTREAYVGPWLPEPVQTDVLGPLESAELRDTVSYATLHLMERLSPPERAVFVLREAFTLPYDDVAEIVGSSSAACRQTYHRARQRLGEGRERFRPSGEEHTRLLGRFLDAARTGDLDALAELFSEDVTVWTDGGGKARAARRPVHGRDKAIAFLLGLASRYAIDDVRLIDVNGQPAVWLTIDGQGEVVTIGIRDGRIGDVFVVLNPDKLAHAAPSGPG
jgi:RNA polymerase sigma-70 factor, ECF subfamily